MLVQMPDILAAGVVFVLLHRWVNLPAGWAAGAFLLWVAKDVAMFPLLREAFVPPRAGPETLEGTRALARERLAPEGYVTLNGELWWARSLREQEVISPGTPVVVRACRGLTLLVEPDRSRGAPQENGGR